MDFAYVLIFIANRLMFDVAEVQTMCKFMSREVLTELSIESFQELEC